jgi:hypothetical protein
MTRQLANQIAEPLAVGVEKRRRSEWAVCGDSSDSCLSRRPISLMRRRLNRSHLLVGKQSFIFPCLGRTEQDIQATGPQSITVEDSMSMVHASMGKLRPASEHLRSEPAILAGVAHAALPNSKVA